MGYKKMIIGGSLTLIIIMALFAVLKQKGYEENTLFEEQVVSAGIPKEKPLPLPQEGLLQKQIQEIIAKGKSTDCVTLADARYVRACQEVFKGKK